MTNLNVKNVVLTFAVIMACTAMFQLPTASAYDDVTRERTELSLMSRKLSRGVVNILTGWLEIPKTIADKWRETDPFTGLVVGTIQGAFWGFARTLTGVYEVVTFPFALPEGYVPIIEPEFVLPTIWGEELPHMEMEGL